MYVCSCSQQSRRFYTMANMIVIPLLAVLACLSACLGASIHQPIRRQSSVGGDLDHFVYPMWSVLNFDGACSPGGCLLTFNLTSAATTSEPAVRAACNINGDELHWQPCAALAATAAAAVSKRDSNSSDGSDGGSVWALPLASVDSFSVSVQHRFANATLTPVKHYNVTGNMTVDFETVSLPVNLTVMGTRVSEIWSWTTSNRITDNSGHSKDASRAQSSFDRFGRVTGRQGLQRL